jgi:hypothetical protein
MHGGSSWDVTSAPADLAGLRTKVGIPAVLARKSSVLLLGSVAGAIATGTAAPLRSSWRRVAGQRTAAMIATGRNFGRNAAVEAGHQEELMIDLIVLLVTISLLAVGYGAARRFVRDKLRFVDAAQRRLAPWIAGAGTAVLTAPVAALLPFIGVGSAIGLGVAVGLGVAAGARDVRIGAGHQLKAGD